MSDRLLRSALTANAAITLLCGVGLVAAGGSLAPRFGLPGPAPLWALAAVYLGFGAALAITARRLRRVEVALVTLLDVGYIAASAGLLLLWPEALSEMGKAVTLALALVVAVLVTLQTAGLRRLARSFS